MASEMLQRDDLSVYVVAGVPRSFRKKLQKFVDKESKTEGGTMLRAELTSRLLQTIFYPGTALHDLAVVIRGRVVHAAGVQLPLAEPQEMSDPSLGSRHRAGVGITKECDALVIMVSEENGLIRIAERGKLSPGFTPGVFRAQLRGRLERNPDLSKEPSAGDTQESAAAAPDAAGSEDRENDRKESA